MIQRRKPLKRSTKPLRRTPLKRVGKKHAAKLRLYRQLKDTFMGVNPYCQAKLEGCTYFATECHHVFKRGKYLNVPSTWLALCASCHRWCHEHPGQARTLNLLK